MHPAVEYGLKVHRAINQSDPRRRWTNIEIIFPSAYPEIEPIVRMEIGFISFDGIKQIRQVTRNYHYQDGNVFWQDHIHS